MAKQAEYMKYQIAGGSRLPGAGGLRLPSAINVNEFGNIPKGLIRQLVQVANKEKRLGKVKARRIKVSRNVEIFYGDPDDVGSKRYPRGIYKRVVMSGGRSRLIPLVVFPQVMASYRPRFDFRRLSEAVFREEFDSLFAEAFQEAQRTAR